MFRGLQLELGLTLTLVLFLGFSCNKRPWAVLPNDLNLEPQPNRQARAILIKPGFNRTISSEDVLDMPMTGRISEKTFDSQRNRVQLKITLTSSEPSKIHLELPVPSKSLEGFGVGVEVNIQLFYPSTDNPVKPETLSVFLTRTDNQNEFVFLHGQKTLPSGLEKELKISWGRVKISRLETSTRAFCERTEDRYAFDISGRAVGRARSIFPGSSQSLVPQRGRTLNFYAGDCSRISGGNCPDDIRGLWDCQIAVSTKH